MTEKGIAARRTNGKRSKGPATTAGRERIREANTRHGFYSPAEAGALACLGEDPAELERLRQRLHDDLRPPSGLEEELVEHLVEVVWRWKRSARGQEGFALRQAKVANLPREDRLHAQMMRLKMTEESLRLLAQSVAHEYYLTTEADLKKMKCLYQEGAVSEMGEIALALFYRLKSGEDEGGPDDFEKAQLMVAQAKEIFGITMPRYSINEKPAIPPRRKRGRIAASPRRNGRRGRMRGSFSRTSSPGKWRSAPSSATRF